MVFSAVKTSISPLRMRHRLLPMPPGPVWSTSSPLKLAEYAAAGLAVVGVNHPGHLLPESREWMISALFMIGGVKGLADLANSRLKNGIVCIILKSTSAARELTFERLAERLEEFMGSV